MVRQEGLEKPHGNSHSGYPLPALFRKTLNRIEALNEDAFPRAEKVINNLVSQLTENVSIQRYNGAEIPFTYISSADLPQEFLQEKPLAHPGAKPRKKKIRFIFSGYGGNILSGLPLAMEEMFSTIKDKEDQEEKPEIICYIIGQPTKVDKHWRKSQREKKLNLHGMAGVDLLRNVLTTENPEDTDVELHGESMSTYTASFVAQSLNESWAPKTKLYLNNPPGEHEGRKVHPLLHFGSRVQLGLGYWAELARRKRKNKKEGVPDSSVEDREYFSELAPILKLRGISIEGSDVLRSLLRAQLWDLWHLGKRPPLPETKIETHITRGINDLTRLSLRDKFAYKKGEHIKTERNIILRLSPTSHTADPLSPKRINSMVEVLVGKEKLLESLEGKILETNWHEDHTYPAPYHYMHLWLWDSVFAANINAQRGDVRKSASELDALLKGVDPETGFIPNMQYRTGRNWRDVESVTFNNPDFGSSYTQPPVIAWGVWQTYQAFIDQHREEEARAFLETQYDRMTKFYSYFAKYRENGNGSRLIGCTFPHETGRDSDPSLRKVLFIEGDGRSKGLLNGLIDYSSVLVLNTKLKWKDTYPEKGRPTSGDVVDFAKFKARKQKRKNIRTDWDPEKTRDAYWINDVMFNAIYANNLRHMAKVSETLGKMDAMENYLVLANRIEKEMLEQDKMWDEETGFFYNLDKNGKKIKIPSITGLFAATLDTISEAKLAQIVSKMEDPNWFNTDYPIPSVPAHSPYYNPTWTEPRLWKRGEVWINANQLIAEEGLVKQIKRTDISPDLRTRMVRVLRRLVEQTEDLVNKDLLENGTTHEMYNAETGEGYRIKGFTWSLGGRHLHKSKALLAELDALAA